MADEQTSPEQRKRELTNRLDRARTNLRRDFSHVRYRTAFGDRTREGVRRHAGSLAAGGLVAGGLAGWRLLRPGPKVKKVYVDANSGKFVKEEKQAKAGFWMGTLSIIFNLAQPAIVAVVQKRLLSLANQENQQVAQDAARTAAREAR